MRFVVSSPLLRNVLIVDAAFSAASGVMLAATATPIASLAGLPHSLVLGAGIFLLPYALFVGTLGLCTMVVQYGTDKLLTLVWFVVAGNALWVAESLVTLAQTSPTAFGLAAIIAQATVVAAIAAGQAIGLRQSQVARVA